MRIFDRVAATFAVTAVAGLLLAGCDNTLPPDSDPEVEPVEKSSAPERDGEPDKPPAADVLIEALKEHPGDILAAVEASALRVRVNGEKKLLTVDFGKGPITDEGLAHLETLKTLTVLDIEFAPVTEQGVARLQESLPTCKINH